MKPNTREKDHKKKEETVLLTELSKKEITLLGRERMQEFQLKAVKIQKQVGSLENQKSEAGAGAYKKMIAFIVVGVVLIIAIIVVLVILLTPKKPADPFSQMINQMGKNASSGEIQDLAKQMEKGLGGLKEQSENIQGKKSLRQMKIL